MYRDFLISLRWDYPLTMVRECLVLLDLTHFLVYGILPESIVVLLIQIHGIIIISWNGNTELVLPGILM